MVETETIYDIAKELIIARGLIQDGDPNKAIELIDDCTNELQDICVEDKICPFCGGDIETVIVKEDCGSYAVHRCEKCKEEF